MKKFSQLAFPYIVWAVLMLVFPMVLIALYSVTDQGNTILSFTFTLEHYAKFFTDPDFLLILWRSIVIAVKTTVICLLLGYPIAYYIARSEQKKQNALILVITIPMWINMLVRTYAWIGLLSDGGLIQRILHMVLFCSLLFLFLTQFLISFHKFCNTGSFAFIGFTAFCKSICLHDSHVILLVSLS